MIDNKKKTEVNLEMCSGFFRIPTDDIIYNITVLASNEPSTTKVVEKIIEVEKIVEVERSSPPPKQVAAPPSPVAAPLQQVDDFFERYSQKIQHEISLVAKDTSPTTDGASAAQAGAIHDLIDMAGELKKVLQSLKSIASQHEGTRDNSGQNLTPALERLAEKISRATNCCPPSSVVPTAAAATPPSTRTVTRYLFNLDTVFQTIYELCTNETVKSHIQNARAKAEEIFDKNAFYDGISPKVSGYSEDDGFLNVPMTDIYTALGSACNDKAICNLLAKMDKQQASIFLDQFLPLEIPPKEEHAVPYENGVPGADSELDQPAINPASDSLESLLGECQADVDKMIYQSADLASPSADSPDDLVPQIEDAMVIAASIQHEARRLMTEDGTSSAEQYPTLGHKIMGLETLTKTMLTLKEQNPEVSYEECLAAGEEAAQGLLDELSTRSKKQTPPSPSAKMPQPANAETTGSGGEASQDDIDRLLAELG